MSVAALTLPVSRAKRNGPMKLTGMTLIAGGLLFAAASAPANERLKGIACRSVHLGYDVPETAAFYVEVRPMLVLPGTYFCACGFDMGYFGMQELADGRRLFIFSVWDQDTRDEQVKQIYADEHVRVQRFGGEGTGLQSFYDYDWKTNTVYRFGMRAKAEAGKTQFAALLYLPETKSWKHLATFETQTGGKLIRDPYSFVEDFKRDRVSTTLTRKAYFGRVEGQTADGKTVPVTRAKFTGDSNPVTNIDAGVEGREFFLMTGGDIQNTHTPLWKWAQLPVVGR